MRYLLPLILLSGCASTMTDDEREYEQAEDYHQLALCEKVYEQLGAQMVSHHMHRDGRRHRHWEVKEDLRLNQCDRLLRRSGLWE